MFNKPLGQRLCTFQKILYEPLVKTNMSNKTPPLLTEVGGGNFLIISTFALSTLMRLFETIWPRTTFSYTIK